MHTTGVLSEATLGWHRPRCDDRSGSAGSYQRLAICRCLNPCRADYVLLVSNHQPAERPCPGVRRRRTGTLCCRGRGKALAFHAGPVAATLLGMLTGIGGGMVRDVLVREIPTVLRTELYAVAALIGAAVVVIGRVLHVPSAAPDTAGAVLCFGLRFMAMRFGWHLPIAHPLSQSDRHTNRSNGE
jgi:hypothetical protein